ncbi:kinesin family protein [Ascobolus immersus RN42]|uniref:Kinesin-like protein n=1 Tax=Ascobolus immersus RN42 TaxID=1160509 RepID=A0A3N4IAF1_ASCIM|nr:kinesin family protein [Ascobolus immersus RN42]
MAGATMEYDGSPPTTPTTPSGTRIRFADLDTSDEESSTAEEQSDYDSDQELHPEIPSSASAPSLRSRDDSPHPGTAYYDQYDYSHSSAAMGKQGDGANVRVVVRVRGFLPREIERGATCIVSMDPATETTTLNAPIQVGTTQNARVNARKTYESKTFTFDNSFWSANRNDPHYADQEEIYNALGEEFLDHNFEGYHTCIFAYGQTGAGKSYTMMGTPENPGLIPRTCEDLFERIESNESPNISYNVRVSYFEVYNENVRDLLVPKRDPPYNLKVRESPTEGPYVKDLTEVQVRNIEEVMRYMRMGDASRTTASTKMNDTSSRSHAVFTLILKQIYHDMDTDETTERMARIRLVDLAGSERANATGATGVRLREGSNINKSLTTLGRVIAALAEASNKATSSRKNKDVVPYRDSVLTWLLKDSLGGNSKTAMIACISPTDYDETLSTLRYADQAKKIRNRAIVNQDMVSSAERDAQIEEMQETIRNLQLNVSQAANAKKQSEAATQQLEEYQAQVERMSRMMEEMRQLSEVKMRALNTQNDALKLHLRLAVDSLKNPIEVKAKDNKENEPVTPRDGDDGKQWNEVEEWGYDDEEEMDELEIGVVSLIEDIHLFRRKLDDDKFRFFHSGEPVRKLGQEGVLKQRDVNRV